MGEKKPKETGNLSKKEDYYAKALKHSLQFFKAGPVQSLKECDERINQFFHHVLDTGEVPTIEKLALSLGISPVVLKAWQIRCPHGAEASELINRAVSVIASVDSEMGAMGVVSPIYYFFRATNFYGMKNTNQVNQTNVEIPASAVLKSSEIKKRLSDIRKTALPETPLLTGDSWEDSLGPVRNDSFPGESDSE